MREKDNGSGQSMLEAAQNIPIAADMVEAAIAEALVTGNSPDELLNDEEFFKSLGLLDVPLGPTTEEIQANSDARELARIYDVAGNLTHIKVSHDAAKRQVEAHLKEVFSFITSEYNAAVLNGDEATQNLLYTAEGPRWYQLAVQDMQQAFMKLERAFTHPQGL